MSRIRPDQLLLPSVLDRLIDHEPDNRFEVGRDRAQLLNDLKSSVRRDLEDLLNTRVFINEIPRDLAHLESSLFNYGSPDLGTTVFESRSSMEALRKRIEEAIRRFETRFKQVRVEFDSTSKMKYSRAIRFLIDGVLYAEPAPEPVTFTSQLNTIAREFRVQDAS